MKQIIVVLVGLLLLGSGSGVWASGHWGEDRELKYIGSWSPFYRTCDHTDGHMDSGYHAIGGGVFCGVYTETRVRVTVEDDHLREPVVRVSCAWERSPTPIPFPIPEPVPDIIIYSSAELGRADPSATFTIPRECLPSHEDDAPEGTTDLTIFSEYHDLIVTAVTCCSYTTGTVTLEYRDQDGTQG